MQLAIILCLVKVVINPDVIILITLYFIDRKYDFVFNMIGYALNYIYSFILPREMLYTLVFLLNGMEHGSM